MLAPAVRYKEVAGISSTDIFSKNMLATFKSIRKVCYLIIAVIGVPVGLVAIVILSRGKCGLSTCTTRYLVAMAAADLLIIISEVILWRLSYYYFYGTFLDMTPVCTLLHMVGRAATDCSVWFTVTFTFDRFVAICCQKLKAKYCTGKTAAVVLATTGLVLSCKNVPLYFMYEPGSVIDNVPWDCFRRPSAYTDPWWVGYDWLATVLTPLLPFSLVMLLNSLTVRHILVASRVRRKLRGQSKGESRGDPQMESRRRSAILLFTISGSFILLWSVSVVDFLYYTIGGADARNYNQSEYIFSRCGDILTALSCCTNTFIYGVTQSKFRAQLVTAVKYPFILFVRLFNKQRG